MRSIARLIAASRASRVRAPKSLRAAFNAAALDEPAHVLGLVSAHVVEDDDVAGAQLPDEGALAERCASVVASHAATARRLRYPGAGLALEPRGRAAGRPGLTVVAGIITL